MWVIRGSLLLWICTDVCGCCLTGLWLSEVSPTEAGSMGGLGLAGGWELPLVAVLMQMRLLMGAWFKQLLAASSYIRDLSQCHAGKEWAFVFSIQLVL